MGNNHVFLQFDPMVTRLAGFNYGKETFANQVEKQVDFANKITIVFPNQIIKIASSFVQGFFEGIIEQVGFKGIGRQVIIETGSESLTKSIFDNLT